MPLINCEECHQQISHEAFVCPKCGFRRYKPSEEDKQVRRGLASTEVKNDWAKSVDHLLRDIQEESLDKTRLESETISRTLARFASLLAVLGKQSDIQTRRIARLTWGLLLLTLALLILTGYLCYDAYLNHKSDNAKHAYNAKQP
jgi:predicted  nucleic acid-binding Zn-ribbon protein